MRYDSRIAGRRQKDYRGSGSSDRSNCREQLQKRVAPASTFGGFFSMKNTLAWRYAALIACAGLGLASPALAQDKTVKIGVLNDMSSLYADIGGPNSVVAVKMAVQDSGLLAKGWKIDVLSGDHQNKPDVGVNMARQWIDVDKVDAVFDTPNSGVALAVSNLVKEKNSILINSGGASADLTGKACTPNTLSVTYDTYMLAHGTGTALTKAGGDTWFLSLIHISEPT